MTSVTPVLVFSHRPSQHGHENFGEEIAHETQGVGGHGQHTIFTEGSR